MRSFSFDGISLYRPQIMGVAAILVLLSHFPYYLPIPHNPLWDILRYGAFGVDMFLFVSGIGIWFSLKKNRQQSKVGSTRSRLLMWYVRRYTRLLIPYFIIVSPFYLFSTILHNLPIEQFFQQILTISFWTSHQGVWFVVLLLPLYLISPFLFIEREIDKRGLIIIALIFLCFYISWNQDLTGYDTIKKNIFYCVKRVPSYLLGFLIAPFVKCGKNLIHPSIVSALILLVGVFAKRYLNNDLYLGVFILPILIYSSILLIERCGKSISSVFVFMGGISLESYLFNVNLPKFLVDLTSHTRLVDLSIIPPPLIYVLSIPMGIFLSIKISRLSSKMLNNI